MPLMDFLWKKNLINLIYKINLITGSRETTLMPLMALIGNQGHHGHQGRIY